GLRVRRQLQRTVTRAGNFPQGFRFAGLVANDLPADERDVIGLEQHRAELLDFGFQVLERVVKRRAANSRSAAAKRSDAILHDGSVAAGHQDVVETDAKFVRGNLREGGFFALAVRTCADRKSTRLNSSHLVISYA